MASPARRSPDPLQAALDLAAEAELRAQEAEARLAEAEDRAAEAERRAWRAEKHVLVAEARARRLLEISRRYRSLVANLPDTTLVVVDEDLRYLVVEGAELPWGTPEDIEGRTVSEIFHGPTAQKLEALYRSVVEGAAPELEITADGRSYLVQGRQLPAEDGKGRTGLVLSRDITGLKQVESALRKERETLRKTVEEREVLLREVYHRVKNNLQVVSSLLSLQARSLSDEGARAALIACRQRVTAMARVHEQLYASPDLARIDLAKYLSDLAGQIDRTYRVGTAVRIERDLHPIEVALEQAIPVGLIAHELLANAFQHAFPQDRAGTLHLQIHTEPGGFVLRVGDDGVGVDEAAARGLGTRLVRGLAAQLEAELHRDTSAGQGTTWTLHVPLPAGS